MMMLLEEAKKAELTQFPRRAQEYQGIHITATANTCADNFHVFKRLFVCFNKLSAILFYFGSII